MREALHQRVERLAVFALQLGRLGQRRPAQAERRQPVHRFANGAVPFAGSLRWDALRLWADIQDGLGRAAASFGEWIASIGVDTWGVDYVLTNDTGRIVFPTHAYRDSRTQAGLQHLTNTRAALDRIYAATGIPAVFYNSSFQLAETVAQCPAITDLATRARAHQLKPDEVQGSTFTITNPGPYGSIVSVPIINQPNTGILSLDAITKRAVVIEDTIAIRSMVNISMSWDHRTIDGEIATRFLARVKQNLETWDFAEDVAV